METYQQQKARHSQEFGAFEGIFFAFSNEQFNDGMEKLGLTLADTDKILSIGAGGYMLKTQREAFKALLAQQDAERKDLKRDEKKLIEAIVYELQNHEYCITYDVTDALDALGLTRETVNADVLKKAIKKHNELMAEV